MGKWLLSRRDRLIVAWHEVPGSAPPQNSRPVGYGVIRAGVRADSMIGVRNSNTKTQNIYVGCGISCVRSYRTLRDGSFEGRFPRHFVPGYDHAVPPGHYSSFPSPGVNPGLTFLAPSGRSLRTV